MFWSYNEIIDFFNLLDTVKLDVEEGKDLNEPYSLSDLCKVNSGNNCLHYICTYNNHRIVIQTYKNPKMNHDWVDIVQGSIDSELKFSMIDAYLTGISDHYINKLFEFYFWYNYYCSATYPGAENSFCCEFGPNVEVWYNDEDSFQITADNASVEDCLKVSTFIEWMKFFHFLIN